MCAIHTSAGSTIWQIEDRQLGGSTEGTGGVPGGSPAVDERGDLFFNFEGTLHMYQRINLLGYSKAKLVRNGLGDLHAIGMLRPSPRWPF